ncbi:MAG: DNA-3-methyladenine glycosylase I [Vulcanimicrobiaceae bacterium]
MDSRSDAVPTIPAVIAPQSAADYFEVVTRAVFQAGVTWRQVAAHWGAYRRAFSDFDVARVARFDDSDIARVLETPGVLRSPRKVRATVANAGALMEIDRAGGIPAYLKSFASYAELSRDLRARLTYFGEMNVWYFLFRVGEPVPDFEQWIQAIPGDHPRMREMVSKKA